MALFTALLLLGSLACAQQPGAAAPPQPPIADDRPLPDIHQLMLDVEKHQIAAEAERSNYTYHVHMEERELNGKGELKKTDVTDSESVTIDDVRVNRVVARNGKPLTPEEAKKENDRIDREVEKNRPHHVKDKDGNDTVVRRTDGYVSAARILELGTFSNPRRVELNGRSTLVVDYAGDPGAKRRSELEAILRDMVGTVWIDERDRIMVRAEGRFLNDFKVAGGLLLNIHKGLNFTLQSRQVNGEVWLPETLDAQGSARILLFGGVNGDLHLTMSDYRKFHTGATILGSSDALPPDAPPLPQPAPQPRP